eukprot:237132_1
MPMSSRTKTRQREAHQESQIILLLMIAYLISIFVHCQIIPYLHMMFYLFIFAIQAFNFIKQGMQWYLMDFPIFIHILIAIHILWFRDNQVLFSLCWILSIGWCSFAILLCKNIIYLDLNNFFLFYTNYSPPLIMYIVANFMLYDEEALQDKTELIENYLMQYIGLIYASAFYLMWALINVACMIAFKASKANKGNNCNTTIPFVQMSRIYA